MRYYWNEIEIKGHSGIECPSCKGFWIRDFFSKNPDITELKNYFRYCPDCGKQLLETEKEVKDREKARKMFSEYWAHYNEEC